MPCFIQIFQLIVTSPFFLLLNYRKYVEIFLFKVISQQDTNFSRRQNQFEDDYIPSIRIESYVCVCALKFLQLFFQNLFTHFNHRFFEFFSLAQHVATIAYFFQILTQCYESFQFFTFVAVLGGRCIGSRDSGGLRIEEGKT